MKKLEVIGKEDKFVKGSVSTAEWISARETKGACVWRIQNRHKCLQLSGIRWGIAYLCMYPPFFLSLSRVAHTAAERCVSAFHSCFCPIIAASEKAGRRICSRISSPSVRPKNISLTSAIDCRCPHLHSLRSEDENSF